MTCRGSALVSFVNLDLAQDAAPVVVEDDPDSPRLLLRLFFAHQVSVSASLVVSAPTVTVRAVSTSSPVGRPLDSVSRSWN